MKVGQNLRLDLLESKPVVKINLIIGSKDPEGRVFFIFENEQWYSPLYSIHTDDKGTYALEMYKVKVDLLNLYEEYFKSAENFIDFLTKNRKKIPDKYFVPYEGAHLDLRWELSRTPEERKRIDNHSKQVKKE